MKNRPSMVISDLFLQDIKPGDCLEDPFDKEVITRIRTRNAEGNTTTNRYRNIDEIESIQKKVNGRVRRFF